VSVPVAQVLAGLDQALSTATASVTLRDLAADPRVSLAEESASATAIGAKEVEKPTA
jgi:hypothetical protein